RLSLHPDGMAPRIANLPEWRAHLLARLHRQAEATGDQRLTALHEELSAYPGGLSRPPGPADVVVPLRYRASGAELSFLSITAVIGTPMDVTVEELAIESFYPADPQTAQAPLAPYVGLWTRLAGFRHEELKELITERAVLRAHLMRNTVHLVEAGDYLRFRPLYQPVLARHLAGNF